MKYLYHRAPKSLQGNILYPLNILKNKYPDIYEKEISKYSGRKWVTKLHIPTLNCLWNDVLHFSAVNPKDIKKALINAGHNPNFNLKYYKVDPEIIEPKNATVYLFLYDKNERDKKMNTENFVPYNPNNIEQFSLVPEETKRYFKETVKQNKKPLLYYKIPHILYKGTLNVSGLQINSI